MNWKTIDWAKRQDIDIAEETGLTRERVRQIRRDGNFPECVNKGRNREKVKFENKINELVKSNQLVVVDRKFNKTIAEIATLTGRQEEYVARALASMEYKAKPANVKYDWAKVDWDTRRNPEIAAEKDTSANYVSRQRRKHQRREDGTQNQST